MCNVCVPPRVFSHKCDHTDHMNSAHGANLPYACNHPGCDFTAYRLDAHKETHSRLCRFPCPVTSCGYVASTSQALARHLRIHGSAGVAAAAAAAKETTAAAKTAAATATAATEEAENDAPADAAAGKNRTASGTPKPIASLEKRFLSDAFSSIVLTSTKGVESLVRLGSAETRAALDAAQREITTQSALESAYPPAPLSDIAAQRARTVNASKHAFLQVLTNACAPYVEIDCAIADAPRARCACSEHVRDNQVHRRDAMEECGCTSAYIKAARERAIAFARDLNVEPAWHLLVTLDDLYDPKIKGKVIGLNVGLRWRRRI